MNSTLNSWGSFGPFTQLSRLLLAGLLAAAAASAIAQNAPNPPPASPGKGLGPRADGMHYSRNRDPAQMQAYIAQRQAEMKAKLNITPVQESAWTAYTAGMQPLAPTSRLTAEQRAELNKLPTPQRIEKMRELRDQRAAERTAAIKKREDATKTLYAVLTPAQQKIFDAEFAKRPLHHGRSQ